MMARIQHAALSYSTDLTRPSAPTLVLGVVAVGELPKGGHFLFVGTDGRTIDPSLDPFGIVRDLPRFIDNRVREGLRAVGPESLIPWMAERLRQSLSLTRLESLEIEAENADELLNGFLALYRRVVAQPVAADKPTVHFEPVLTAVP